MKGAAQFLFHFFSKSIQMPANTPVIHHHPAHHPSTKPPLLFIHGGYSNAALWGVRFIPYFQDQGYDCYALELSGHGSLPGIGRIWTISVSTIMSPIWRRRWPACLRCRC